ncbi:ankyrin repeat domain-containing protein [Steroidobacter cummioxidans]|uniref:ankyrin repeat domain-containing protein n=1 Tax=Steroidobacter cummioxidans TaxID=1803913 RepID=UPI000E324C79|nr:ankyrin repeat domain-containing protein [Steroidobacter cummioxidans]
MTALTNIGPFAFEQRWAEVEEILHGLGSIPEKDRSTLLCELCFYGNVHSIEMLLDRQADVNFRFEYEGRSNVAYRVVAYPRTTPVGQAILGRSQGRFQTLDTLRLLLQAKADPNLHTYQGYTPLQLAIIEDCPDHAEALLSAGANPHLLCEDPLIPDGDAFYFAKEYGRERAWAHRLLPERKTQDD